MPQTLFGHLGFADAATPFGDPSVQRVFLDETTRLMDEYNAETEQLTRFMISRTVEDPQLLYDLYEVGGMMQQLGGHDQPKAIRGHGEYTVGFSIQQFGDKLADERVGVAYMTVERFDRRVDQIFKRHSTRLRYEMMRRIFNNTTETFKDPVYGNLTVYPIANGDGILYPVGNSGGSPTAANHFIATAYLPAAISDANNPIAAIVAKLAVRFPDEVNAGDVLVFINSAQKDKISALADFMEVPAANIRPSPNDPILVNIPALPRTAQLIGRTSNAWVATWDAAVDDGYMFGTLLGVDAPLFKRVDTQASGLPRGLTIWAEKGYDENWPFREQIWGDRFGFGAGNRLSAVALFLAGDSVYDVPARYL